jgi:hypothetical protein
LANRQYVRYSHRRSEIDLRSLAETIAKIVPRVGGADVDQSTVSGGVQPAVANHFASRVDARYASFGVINH